MYSNKIRTKSWYVVWYKINVPGNIAPTPELDPAGCRPDFLADTETNKVRLF